MSNGKRTIISFFLKKDRIRNKDVLFTVSTNGLYKEILEYNKDFPFIDYIVGYNGGVIYDCLNKNIICDNLLKPILSKFKIVSLPSIITS